jgi:hypothetical protein
MLPQAIVGSAFFVIPSAFNNICSGVPVCKFLNIIIPYSLIPIPPSLFEEIVPSPLFGLYPGYVVGGSPAGVGIVGGKFIYIIAIYYIYLKTYYNLITK